MSAPALGRGERGQDLAVLQRPPGPPKEKALAEDADAEVSLEPAFDVQDRPAAWEPEAAEALAGEGADDVHGALGVGRHGARLRDAAGRPGAGPARAKD